MPFTPTPHDTLTLDGVAYRIAEHPAAPGMPHGQEGRAGIVYRLVAPADGADQALKVFKPRFRLPYLVAQAERIAPYAGLPGLAACRRTVLTPQRHAPLLRQHPDLTYAVLMPWIEGPTWQEVLLEKKPLAPEQALALARGLAEALMRLEEQGIAHCDLSAPNVMLPALNPSPNPQSPVQLVDLEGLYAPGMLQPQALSSGSAGYAHRQAADGLWGPEADRFAGAVLLAEMLGWGDPQVVHAAWGESYFDPAEMQTASERYRLLTASLQRTWGEAVVTLFDRAWRSETLADCPTFGEWVMALPERAPVGAERRSAPTKATDLTRAQVQALMEAARRLEEKGNLDGALETYRQAQALAAAEPALTALAQEIGLIGQALEAQRQRVPAPPAPPPAPPPTAVVEPGAERRRRRRGVVGVVLLLAVVVAAIGWVWWQRQQEMVAQATATAQAQATATAQAQATATAQAMVLPVLVGTPVPRPAATISAENARQLLQLSLWGEERVLEEDPIVNWSPKGTWLTVRSTSGLRLYSRNDFTRYQLVETGLHPAISPDETLVASAVVTQPNRIRLSNLHTGKVTSEWQPHQAPVESIWFVGNTLVSQDENNTLCAHNVTSSPPQLLLCEDDIQGEIFTSKDAKLLVAVNTKSEEKPIIQHIRVCRIDEGKCETADTSEIGGLILDISANFNDGGEGTILLLKPDGRLVAIKTDRTEVATLGVYTDTKRLLWNAELSPKGTYAQVENKIVRVSDGETLLDDILDDIDESSGVFSPDETYYAWRDFMTVYVFDLVRRRLANPEIDLFTGRRTVHFIYPYRPLFSPDGSLVSVDTGGQIYVFNSQNSSRIGVINLDMSSPILGIAFDTTDDFITTISGEAIKTRSISTGQTLRDLRNDVGLDFFIGDDGLYAKKSKYDTIDYSFISYTPEQRYREFSFNRPSAFKSDIVIRAHPIGIASNYFVFSSGGKLLAVEGFTKSVSDDTVSVIALYHVGTPDPFQVTTLPELMNSMDFSPDASLLAVELENRIILLKVSDLTTIGEVSIPEGIEGFVFSPDSQSLAILTREGNIFLWQRSNGSSIPLESSGAAKGGMAFSPDGTLLVAAGNHEVRIYQVSTQQLLSTLRFSYQPYSLAFSHDQKFLAVGTWSEEIYLLGVR